MAERDARQAESFDVVVIGAGTAGLAAAKAADLAGARVAVVDHGPLGTLCARLGCMPSKILLHSAETAARVREAAAVGVAVPGAPRLDWPAVRARTRDLVADFVGHVVRATEGSRRFALLRGRAEFEADSGLRVGAADGARRLHARAWVVATGSRPTVPPLSGLESVPYLTSDDVFELDAIPASVAVIGGGPIGVELGQFLARAGAAVDLIEAGPSLAGLPAGPLLDALAAPLGREMRLHLATSVRAVRRDGAGVVVALEGGGGRRELRAARLLLAAGRHPNLAGLGLERVGVRVEGGVPVHDAYLRTTNPAVLVAGDAAGPPALLHTASLQGQAAGHTAARPDDPRVPPLAPPLAVVFCDPAVATVGLDPQAAADAGLRPCVARRPWAEQGKARVVARTEGLAQLVVDAGSRRVLGAQIVGAHADLLIHLVSYAMQLGATVDDLAALHHYHPTLAEMIPSLAERAIRQLDGADALPAEVAACAELQ